MEELILELDDPNLEPKKDETGKIINKFLSSLDKIIHSFKNINNEVNFEKEDNTIRSLVVDREISSDNILNTSAFTCKGKVFINNNYYKLIKEIYEDFSFTIISDEYLIMRKEKTKNPVIKISIIDKDNITFFQRDGNKFIFSYNERNSNDILIENEGELKLLNEEPFVLSDEDTLSIRTINASNIFSLKFDLEENKVFFNEYYDFSSDDKDKNLYKFLLLKKYLIGFTAIKKKEKYLCSKIEFYLYDFIHNKSNDNLLAIKVNIINDIYCIEQDFITIQ